MREAWARAGSSRRGRRPARRRASLRSARAVPGLRYPSFVRGPTPRRHLDRSVASLAPTSALASSGRPRSRSRGGRVVPWSRGTRALARACAALRARDDGPRACEGHGAAARSEPGRARHRHGLRLVRRGARRHRAEQADREEPQGGWHPSR